MSLAVDRYLTVDRYFVNVFAGSANEDGGTSNSLRSQAMDARSAVVSGLAVFGFLTPPANQIDGALCCFFQQAKSKSMEDIVSAWSGAKVRVGSGFELAIRKGNEWSAVAVGTFRAYGDGTLYFDVSTAPVRSAENGSVGSKSSESRALPSVELYTRSDAVVVRSGADSWFRLNKQDCGVSTKDDGKGASITSVTSERLINAVGGNKDDAAVRAHLIQDVAFLVDPRELVSPSGDDDMVSFGNGVGIESVIVAIDKKRVTRLSGIYAVERARLKFSLDKSRVVNDVVLELHSPINEAKEESSDYWDARVSFQGWTAMAQGDIPKNVETLLVPEPEKK